MKSLIAALVLMAAGQGRWAAFHTGSRFLTKRRGREGTGGGIARRGAGA